MSDANTEANAARYEWIRQQCFCPFAETDKAWDSPEALDAAIDLEMGRPHE